MPQSPRRTAGKWTIFGLAALIAVVIAGLVTWARLTPAVPDARARLQGKEVRGLLD